jgi:beta-lactamase regulating signal transducer with metallopeptidase domain
VAVVNAMLSNAAVAALLALVALAVWQSCRSPVIRHAAWVVVLLKLLTPPLFTIHLHVLPASWEEPPANPPMSGVIHVAPSATETSLSPAGATPSTPTWWVRYGPSGILDWAVVAWVVGAVAWFVWQGRRIIRFRRRVASAEDAPAEVAEAASRLAAALRIAHPPAVKVATGIASPMLWGWGRGAAVLFPRELLERISPEARDTLLAHELAHFLRRDHWVRVLEFIATGLFWWHPAVWIARIGIEAAEEECCDAWVVGGLAASPRRYAEALLATVDFEAELRRPCLPPGACAANRSARLLRRRLFGIINARRPRPLRGKIIVWALLIAALLTRPVLRAATQAPGVGSQESGVGSSSVFPDTRPPTPGLRPPKTTEPRAWATAEAPGGGLTVLARDHEVVLRHPDGTTRVLGPGRPLSLAFAPGNRRLATAGPGTLVRIWDEQGSLLTTEHTSAAARAIAFTHDGTQLLVLDAAGEISVHDPQTLAIVSRWSVAGPANSITCAPDGRTVAVSFGSWMSESGWVECWSIGERRRISSYTASAPVGATRFAPDGRILVIGCWNGVVAWRGLPNGELIAERELPKHLVATAAFSPDAGTLPVEVPLEQAPMPSPVPQLSTDWIHRAGQNQDR